MADGAATPQQSDPDKAFQKLLQQLDAEHARLQQRCEYLKAALTASNHVRKTLSRMPHRGFSSRFTSRDLVDHQQGHRDSDQFSPKTVGSDLSYGYASSGDGTEISSFVIPDTEGTPPDYEVTRLKMQTLNTFLDTHVDDIVSTKTFTLAPPQPPKSGSADSDSGRLGNTDNDFVRGIGTLTTLPLPEGNDSCGGTSMLREAATVREAFASPRNQDDSDSTLSGCTSQSSHGKLSASETLKVLRASSTMNFLIEDIAPCPCCRRRTKDDVKLLKQDSLRRRGNGGSLFEPLHNAVIDLRFDSYVGVLILANVITMMVELQWEGEKAAKSLGFQTGGSWQEAQTIFDVLEYFFSATFLIELLMRIYFYGLQFFLDISNMFDTFLVVTSLISAFLSLVFGSERGQGANLTMFRLFRLMKLARLFRALRTVKLFRDLNIMVMAIASSLKSVLWSMVLLGLIVIWCSTFLCQLVLPYVTESSNPTDTRRWIYEHYGSTTRASFTMFQATMSGCWPQYSQPLIEQVNGWYVVFWILYVAVVVFAVTRIISGYFFLEAMAAKQNSTDLLVAEQSAARAKILNKLNNLFKEADKSGDGLLDRDEFEQVLEHPEVRLYLQSLELDIHEEKALFQLIDDGDNAITYGEFITGVMRLKGQARAIDLVAVMRDLSKLRMQVSDLSEIMTGGFLHNRRGGTVESNDFCTKLTSMKSLSMRY